ncbi:MAG: sigma-70 family RNA polymerase sigma factor [Planctomycetes bacterium]|nr:sigma-70 family RNA polymerase sigma factor [Planctomycetota bacterium]NOG55446.1 sigma-70 family RNA polymerase sigma factor [Planctomycetota bacterium]
MLQASRTTTALLEGLLAGGDAAVVAEEGAWEEFDRRYRPILVAFGRRLGLGESDAADVAQEAIVRFLTSYRSGKYDRDKGRLRSWLIGIARHCAADLRSKRAGKREARGQSAFVDLADSDEGGEMEAIWEAAQEREVLRQALVDLRASSRLKTGTIDLFERIAFGGQTAAAVASECGVTTNDVYLAKHRCLTKLRSIIEQYSEVYDL